jgi:Lon-like ATP-dependent protease
MIYRVRRKTGLPVQRTVPKKENGELLQLKRMRERSLSVPLSEITRPARLEDIIGQQEGIKALKAALCGPNPQHVLIYGPPGIGKTCAARLVLEEAKKCPDSPFSEQSQFVEIDATCVRFDERAIADPLLGSVHDPIYQGAGALGAQGVPQPKPGAVTRAHCGILFLDEIGELHPIQMNKLLKVLEDRKVYFESAYYSKDNTGIPPHIHDIFQNGLPADFRLVGATTRRPEDMPPALRSRCIELFFRPLGLAELTEIAFGAAKRTGYLMEEETARLCAIYAQSGRDVVNIVQLACGSAYMEKRTRVEQRDIEWVARTCNYSMRVEQNIDPVPRVGKIAALAVTSLGSGSVLGIECTAVRTEKGKGSLVFNGAVEEEELELRGRKLKRRSTAFSSLQNVIGAFRECFEVDCRDYDICINIPGGVPMDGPSAGVALAVALMSAITDRPPEACLALTGEVAIRGDVLPVGGVREKICAAITAGAKRILVPEALDH